MIQGSLSTVSAPTEWPITLDDAKAHMNVTFDVDDALISSMIAAASEHIQSETGRDIMQHTRAFAVDDFVDDLLLPRAPVQTVNSIQYIDTSGVPQTLATDVYALDAYANRPLIRRLFNKSWPSARNQARAVTITFTTGYPGTGDEPPSRDNIPEALRHAIRLIVGDLYENREAQTVIPGQSFQMNPTVERLISHHRIHWF